MNAPALSRPSPSGAAHPAPRLARLAPPLFALLTFAVHAACGGRYGIFRDELYFIACGERLQAGYVDQPPGIALVARLAHALFGSWVPGLRLLPWLAAAATTWLVGRLALRLGGGPRGALVASATAFAAPLLLGVSHLLTMNAFEVALLTALALLLVRLVQGEDPRLWVAAGGVAGLAVLFKYTAGIVAVALLAGLLATQARRALRSRWALAGALVALAVVLPNLAWQAANGFPFLELVRRGQEVKNAPMSTAGFLLELWLEAGPLNVLVWLPGLAWLLLSRAARPARFLGVAVALYLGALLASHGKPYYAGAILPVLLAAGGAAWGRRTGRAWPAWALTAALLLMLPPALPSAIPILPEDQLVAHLERMHLQPAPMERDVQGELPQVFADMHGWQALADGVARVVETLPPEQRATAVVYGSNYGIAAAVDVLGKDLPPAISGHNQYWLWGLPPGRGDPVIVVSDAGEDCGGVYRERIEALRLPHDPYIRPFEDAHVIWICRGLTGSLPALWPRLKHYE
ncbi:MAG: glycosyltransferase family 39 protein [Anaeromyxobacter sp.]